ncbi:MAG: hypothetical protein ABIA74_04895 [bacterium]
MNVKFSELSENQITKIAFDTAHKISKQYTTSLIKITEKIKNPEIGTGTFVRIGCECGILTNHHVADIFIDKKMRYVNVPNPKTEKTEILPFKLIISLPYISNEPNAYDIDLAFILLKNNSIETVNNMGKEFWDLNQSYEILKKNKKIIDEEHCFYFIYGTVTQGMKTRFIDNLLTFILQNDGSYIVVPDLDNIKLGKCHYGNLTFNCDLISCPSDTKKNYLNLLKG